MTNQVLILSSIIRHQAVLLLSLAAAALATPQFPDYGFYDYGGFPDYFDYGRPGERVAILSNVSISR